MPITTCPKCWNLYEAGSEEQANEPDRRCQRCEVVALRAEVAALRGEAQKLRQTLAESRDAIDPVHDWYQPEELPDRTLPEMLRDIVCDLQSDRADALKLPNLRADNKALRERAERAERRLGHADEAINTIGITAEQSPELNMANYNEDDVSALNQGMIDVALLVQSYRKLQAAALSPALAAEGKGRCTCWLGRPGATGGSSAERQACAVHGDPAPAASAQPAPAAPAEADPAGPAQGGAEATADVLHDLAEILEELQWSAGEENQVGTFVARCPGCGARMVDGHYATCRLAKLLRQAQSQAPATAGGAQ